MKWTKFSDRAPNMCFSYVYVTDFENVWICKTSIETRMAGMNALAWANIPIPEAPPFFKSIKNSQ